MADKLPDEFEEAFKDFNIDVPEDIVSDPRSNKFSNLNPISGSQRWIIKNIFDSQPKRRRAYLKKYGYEMSPDGEGYRPIGIKTDFLPIEPEGEVPLGAPGQFGGLAPGGLGRVAPETKLQFLKKTFTTKEGIEEVGRDLTDASFDLLLSTPLQALGGVVGAGFGAGVTAPAAAAATAATGGAAAPVAVGGVSFGALLGSAMGSAGGEAVAENIKAAIGDQILGENIPLDMEEYLIRVGTAGVLGGVGKGAEKFLRSAKTASVKSYSEALEEVLARKLGGTPVSQKVAADVMSNPTKYTPDAVNGAGSKLKEIRHQLLGTSTENPISTKDLRGGIAKDVIKPLNDMADLEVQKLAQNRDADFTVNDIVKEINERVKPLREQAFYGGRGEEGKEALEYLDSQIASLKKQFKVDKPKPSTILDESGKPIVSEAQVEEYRPLNFKETRDFFKILQKATFAKGGVVKENPTLKHVTGGLKEKLDVMAGELGSDLPEIKAKQHQILKLNDALKKVTTPAMVQSAYFGPKGNTAREIFRDVMKDADAKLGTRMSEATETAQFQSKLEELYDNPKAFKGGLLDAMREGLSGVARGSAQVFPAAAAVKGATSAPVLAPATLGAGIVGGIRAARVASAFKSPDILIQTIGKTKGKLADLAKEPFVIEMSMAPWRYPVKTGLGAAKSGLQRPATAIAPAAAATQLREPTVQPPLAPPPEPAPAGVPQGGAASGAAAPAQAAALPEEFEEAFKDFKLPEDINLE